MTALALLEKALRKIANGAYDEWDECHWCRLPLEDEHRPDCPVLIATDALLSARSAADGIQSTTAQGVARADRRRLGVSGPDNPHGPRLGRARGPSHSPAATTPPVPSDHGLDVERLAQALSCWSAPISGEGDPEFVAWAAQMIRSYLRTGRADE